MLKSYWQLRAVDLCGISEMRRISDPSLSYQAHDGITIDAIGSEYAGTQSA